MSRPISSLKLPVLDEAGFDGLRAAGNMRCGSVA